MRDNQGPPASADPRFRAAYDGRDPSSVAEMIPEGPLTVLDVGCARGGFASWLAARGNVVDGVTWDAAEVQAAAGSCRKVFQWDVNDGLPQLTAGCYDLIACSHVIEHIAYPQPLLRDAFRLLRAGGWLLVVVPNLFFWRDRWQLLRGNWRYEAHGTFDYTHLRWYTRETMTELLADHGFVPDRFVADGWVSLPGLRFLIGTTLRHKINRVLCQWRPGLFGEQLMFRVRKPADAGKS